jgi:hypothetical protein
LGVEKQERRKTGTITHLKHAILTMLLVLGAQGPSSSAQVSRDLVLTGCAQLFGERVEESPILFGVNSFYVLRIRFDKNGELEQAAVEPRYYYADTHPDWEEPDNFEWLSATRVADLLAKIDRLRRIGNLVSPHRGIVIITNSTAPITDEHEHATVRRGEIPHLEGEPVFTRYLRVQFKGAP